jgi:hypothetical protein
LYANADTRHQSFPCLFSLFFDVLSHDLVTPPEYECDECDANEQCETQKGNVDGHRVVLEDFVCCSVKCGLGEVEQAGKADNKSVDLTESSETKDFGRVIAVKILAVKHRQG